MQTLNLDLGTRRYPIHIGSGLLARLDLISPHVTGNRVVIITNATVAAHYLNPVRDLLAPYRPLPVVLPDGEQHKNLESLGSIVDAMLAARCDRATTIVALGGGVVGDLAGFAAACYQRGVPFIQIPTTLLAQVDSSVGGKTGVNHTRGKNMIGAFYQPRAVVIDIDTLGTLPDKELRAGLAEVIKYGLIRDAEFLGWLEANMDALLGRDPAALTYAITRSCQHKAEIVAADETESGVRALLNFGHTFGHAIETGLGYGKWLHGEAVAAGMVMAADLSHRLGHIGGADVARIEKLIARAGLPVRPPPTLDAARFLELMSVDKKAAAGKLRLVVLRAIGRAVVTDQVPAALLGATLGHRPGGG